MRADLSCLLNLSLLHKMSRHTNDFQAATSMSHACLYHSLSHAMLFLVFNCIRNCFNKSKLKFFVQRNPLRNSIYFLRCAFLTVKRTRDSTQWKMCPASDLSRLDLMASPLYLCTSRLTLETCSYNANDIALTHGFDISLCLTFRNRSINATSPSDVTPKSLPPFDWPKNHNVLHAAKARSNENETLKSCSEWNVRCLKAEIFLTSLNFSIFLADFEFVVEADSQVNV